MRRLAWLPVVVALGCGASSGNPPGPTAARPVLSGDACVCEGAAGDVCVLQLGGPAVQVDAPPNLSCRRGCQFLVPPTPAGVCNCVAQGPVERCSPSALVTNLCDCDNGVR
jgi:hypothetical protein